MTKTVFRSIPLPTVRLAGILRSIANRPTLNRQQQHRADRIQQELEWRATQAMASL